MKFLGWELCILLHILCTLVWPDYMQKNFLLLLAPSVIPLTIRVNMWVATVVLSITIPDYCLHFSNKDNDYLGWVHHSQQTCYLTSYFVEYQIFSDPHSSKTSTTHL